MNSLSDASFDAPYKFIGFEALSVDKAITFFTPHVIAVSIIFDAPTGQNVGQAVTTSGGVAGTTGQAMETLSPFMSSNYIIYTGKV